MKMKKVISLLALVLVLVCSVNFCFADTAAVTTADTTSETTPETTYDEAKTETEEAATSPMKDIDGSTDLGKSIAKLIAGGVVNGYLEADGTYTYRPLNPITRAEFCKMINTTFDYTIMADNKFTDVTPADWYYIHVLPAIHYGYIQGYQDGTFRGNDYITREEVCTILSRILDQTTDKEVVITDTVSDWAVPYVTNIIALGYMPLEADGKFRATDDMTRGELAVTLDDFVVIKEPEKAPTVNVGGSTGTGTGGNTSSGGNTTVKPSTGGSSGSGNSANSGNNGSSGDDNNQGSGDSGNQGTPDTPTETSYKITYNLNNGTLSGQRTTYKASDADYTLPTPTKNGGYKFFGWYETAEFDGEPVTVLASGSTGDKTYYAKWAYEYKIQYKINPVTYAEDDPDYDPAAIGKLDGTQKTKYTEYDEDYELPIPEREDGVPFIGWYEPREFNGTTAIFHTDEPITVIPAGTTGNLIYHAVWEDMQEEYIYIYDALAAALKDIALKRLDEQLTFFDECGILPILESAMQNVVGKYDIDADEILTTFEDSETGETIVCWEEQGVMVSSNLVRTVYAEQIAKIKEIYDPMDSENREILKDECNALNSKVMMDLATIFNVNLNYGN